MHAADYKYRRMRTGAGRQEERPNDSLGPDRVACNSHSGNMSQPLGYLQPRSRTRALFCPATSLVNTKSQQFRTDDEP